MQAGVHFPSDHIGGRILAGLVVQALQANPAFQAAWKACEAEVRAAQAATR
jgi:acid phosphatase (class A)